MRITGLLSRSTVLCSLLLAALPSLALAQSTIAGGTAFTVIVKNDGTVWAFGTNSDGQLGDNTTTPRKSPVQVAGLSNIQAVAASGGHVLALTSAGTVYSWGDNSHGQVGNSVTGTDRKTPYSLSLSNVVAIAAGEFHSLALTSSGDVYAWGENGFGELGNTFTTDTNAPAVVQTGVTAIGAGRYHSLAVKSDGTAWAWGRNNVGQLGNATTTTAATTSPVQMAGVTGAVAVYGGDLHTIVRLSDGTLKAAGENSAGQLGDTFSTDRSTAVQVSAVSSVQQVSVGANHTLALKSDGSVWAWGDNANGRLGIGSTTDAHTPVTITALSNTQFIGAGAGHSIAVDNSGVVTTWGLNTGNQLGDGTTAERWTPVALSGPAYAWRVATPTFSPVANTYSVNQNVTITSDTLNAVIHFTLTGADPTEADPAYSAPVLVDQSLVLKARAWKVGMPESEVSSATYEMQAAQPTVSPAATTYTVPKTVTFSSTTPGTSIRYTTDGSNPTESSTLYTGPFLVEHTTTFKIAAFKTGWTASTVRTSTYTMNFGTLSAPVIDPPSGTYTGSVTMTVSTTAPGVVRYTTSNTGTPAAPTASSPADTPKIFTQTTNVRARSFHPDYTPSVGEVTRTYTVIAHTPTLSASSGSYAPGSIVTISAGDPLDVLRMTIDGSDPTSTSPIVASGSSLLLGAFTLKVKAIRANANDSAIASATYSLTGPLGPGSASGGSAHSIVATPDGRVYAFGENGNGQLGIESLIDQSLPTLLNTITGVTNVSIGLAHTLARTWDGQVYAWGSNTSGRLGDGTTTQRTKPTHLTSLTSIVAVAAGDAHSMALDSDGRVFSWGENSDGQLGLGSTVDTSTPTEIPGLAGVVAIAAGDTHSMAVTAAGALYMWGNNANSRLGDGLAADRTSPFLLGLGNVVAVAAGDGHSLAMTRGGAVYSWGLGTSGQLGRGNTSPSTTPTLISGLWAIAIAAAGTNSAAIRSDGVLVAWGDNASGQIGDTTSPTDRLQPTIVAGPSSVSTIALGALHVIAAAPSGDVWTWGDFASGRLGDGSIADRPTPAVIMSGVTSWAPAAPTVDTPSGTLSQAQFVTLTSSTSGASIRYTLNGADPTESDPEVPPNGQIEISYSSQLRARAFAASRAPGAMARADYEVVALSISPVSGTYTSAQTITISALGPSAPIRYTLDGSDPTAASTLYTEPFTVSTGMIVSARAFPTGVAPSALVSATYMFNYGTLAAPSVSPAGGVFLQAPQVSLTAMPGASIRYTVNGATPTAASTLYTAPIAIATGGATLKSIALHPDWTTSGVRSDVYVIDTTPPTITAHYLPALLNSWSRTPVTVSFYCADNVQIASCSSPMTFSEEGAGQSMTGTAVDSIGNQTQLPVTLNLDLTPPAVTLTSPINGSVTTSSTLEVTGQAADSLSGLAAVKCNDVDATVVDGALACSVPLRAGRNVVVISARDVAGNNVSEGVTVNLVGTVTQLSLTPSQRTMLVAERQSLSLRDEFGLLISLAAWQTSDSSIVSLSADDPPVLTAVAPGQATILATKNGINASAQITVFADQDSAGKLPTGTTRWKLPTPTSSQSRRTAPIFTYRVDADGPALFTVEPNFATGEYTVRAVSADGGVLWKEAAPGLPLMGDRYGAVIAGVEGEYRCALYFGEDRFCFKAFVRFGGSENALPWRYDSAGYIDRPAQSPDGTIYAIEHIDGSRNVGTLNDAGNNKSIVILDGATGQVTARVALPPETSRSANSFNELEPLTLGPIVGSDGNGYVLARKRDQVFGATTQSWTVLRLSKTGQIGSVVVDECQGACSSYIDPQQFLPDGIGGLLLRVNRWAGNQSEPRLMRFDAEWQPTEHVLSVATRIDLVGQAGTVYLQTRTGNDDFYGITEALDFTTFTSLWTKSPGWNLTAAKPDGGGTAIDSAGQFLDIDSTGQLSGTMSLGLAAPVSEFDSLIGQGNGELTALAADVSDATRYNTTLTRVAFATYEPNAFGDRAGASTQREIAKGIWLKSHKALHFSIFTFPLSAAQHASFRITPHDIEEWKSHPTFGHLFNSHTDKYGNASVTVGGGPPTGDTTFCLSNTVLNGAPNRPADQTTAPDFQFEVSAPYVQHMWVGGRAMSMEDIIIELLLGGDATYIDGSLVYQCVPDAESNSYNSNSYFAGLLYYAGIEMPFHFTHSLSDYYPGILRPVPRQHFAPQ